MTEKGIALVNKLQPGQAKKLFERVLDSLPLPDSALVNRIFTVDELETLVGVFQVESVADIVSVLECFSRILKAAGFEQATDIDLRRRLIETGLLESLAEALVQIWSAKGQAYIDRLKARAMFGRQLVDVNYLLNVEISSNMTKVIDQPTASMQFVTMDSGEKKETLALEFDYQQLFSFYEQLECIQKQFDSLSG